MTTHLSRHFKQRREEKKLTFGQLARLAGYRNLSKGTRRIQVFEATGHVHPDLFTKLIAAMEVDEEMVKRLNQQDYEDWNEYVSQPIRPYLVMRLIAAVYNTVQLPEEITSVKEAERFAAAVARKHRLRCCLVLSRRISIYFATDGTITSVTEAMPGGGPNEPYMQIGGRKCRFREVEHGIVLEQLQWPLRRKE